MPRAVGAVAERFPTRKGAQVQVPYRPPQNRRSETIVSDLFRFVSRREPNPLFHHSLVDRVHSLNETVPLRPAPHFEQNGRARRRSVLDVHVYPHAEQRTLTGFRLPA